MGASGNTPGVTRITHGGARRGAGFRAALALLPSLLLVVQPARAPGQQSPASTSIPQTGGIGLTDWDRAQRVQPTTGTDPVPVGRMGTGPTPLEQQAEGVEQSGIFSRLGSGMQVLPSKVGPIGGLGAFRVALSQRLRVPLFEIGLRPEDAEIKLGRLYLDWRTVTLAYLVSDNIFQTLQDRKLGHVMVVRSELAMIYQVTDTLQLSLAGEVGWLPFRGEVGFTDPLLDLDLNAAPLAAIQISYEMPTPTWTYSITDTFTVRRESLGFGRNYDILDRNPRDLVDRAGRYDFTVRQVTSASTRGQRPRVDYQNSVALQATRLYPTQTRVTASFQHDDTWYGSNTNFLPRTLDQANLVIANERENLRFKPYAQLTATKVSDKRGLDRQLRGGLRGPVTPYVEFFGEGGYLWAAEAGRESETFSLGLIHDAKHNFRHSLVFARSLEYPQRNLTEQLTYDLDYMLHTDTLLTIVLNRATFEFLNAPGIGGEQRTAAGRLTWLAGPRLTIRPGLAYTQAEIFGPAGETFEVFTARVDTYFQFARRIRGELSYRYEERTSNNSVQSYYEHLGTFTLIMTF